MTYQRVYITYLQLNSLHGQPPLISFLETLGNRAPVDDFPDGAEVLGLAVLVLQVVGMLPGVNTQQRFQISGDRILVGAGDKTKSARGLVLDEPGPTRALNASKRSIGLLLQVVERPEVLVDGSLNKKKNCKLLHTLILILIPS